MKLIALILSMLPLLTLSAQEPAALVIRNLKMDMEKTIVDFDVVNQSSKPVQAWLMRVDATKEPIPGDVKSGLQETSESCPQPMPLPLGSSQSRHCSVYLGYIQREGPPLFPQARITAILFEDGTAEGDLRLLDRTIEERRMRSRALQYWLGQLEQVRSGNHLVEGLQKLEKMLTAPDSSVPEEFIYDSTALWEREILRVSVSNLLQYIDNHRNDPGMALSQFISTFKLRTQAAYQRAQTFPSRSAPHVRDEVQPWTRLIGNRAAGLRVVRAEVRDNDLRLLLRNEYSKVIVEFAIVRRQGGSIWGAAGGDLAPGAIRELKVSLTSYSDVDVEISYVIFKDGTAEGDLGKIQEWKDQQAGSKVTVDRNIPERE